MIRRALLIIAILVSAFCAPASEPLPERTCAVCDRTIKPDEKAWVLNIDKSERLADFVKAGSFTSTQVYTNSDRDNLDKLPVGVYVRLCEECHTNKARCTLCGLPVKEKGIRTSDGRLICARDKTAVVMDEETARELFESAREAAVDVVGGYFALKTPAVNVRVTDVFDRASGADGLHTVAISKSTDSGSGIVHYVSVYTGSLKKNAFYSCVHEYTHLWINENIGEHVIEKNTREGLCELVAFKVAEARSDAAAQQHILTNPYTKGRIKDLVAYSRDEDLSSILNWVRNGKTLTLAEGVATATAAKARPPEIPLDIRISQAQQATRRSQPETLSLNGIVRTPKGMIILLNGGVILSKGESGLVKLNGKQSNVRCIDIQPDSAIVQLENTTNTVELDLSHK